jgi:hypothetical protein
MEAFLGRRGQKPHGRGLGWIARSLGGWPPQWTGERRAHGKTSLGTQWASRTGLGQVFLGCPSFMPPWRSGGIAGSRRVRGRFWDGQGQASCRATSDRGPSSNGSALTCKSLVSRIYLAFQAMFFPGPARPSPFLLAGRIVISRLAPRFLLLLSGWGRAFWSRPGSMSEDSFPLAATTVAAIGPPVAAWFCRFGLWREFSKAWRIVASLGTSSVRP